MTKLLKGINTARPIRAEIVRRVELLANKNVVPTLAVVRVGNNSSDEAYWSGIKTRFEALGLKAAQYMLDENVSQQEFNRCIQELSENKDVHAVLIMRPLPTHLDEVQIESVLAPEKDVDGMLAQSLGSLFKKDLLGFAPCTVESVVWLLEYEEISLDGALVVIMGRSAVVGKPLVALLSDRNATCILSHTHTQNLKTLTQQADIVVVCTGKPGSLTKDMVSEHCVVVDVGINEVDGALVGDASFDELYGKVEAITPVPGGVGVLTTTILADHTLIACEAIEGSSV